MKFCVSDDFVGSVGNNGERIPVPIELLKKAMDSAFFLALKLRKRRYDEFVDCVQFSFFKSTNGASIDVAITLAVRAASGAGQAVVMETETKKRCWDIDSFERDEAWIAGEVFAQIDAGLSDLEKKFTNARQRILSVRIHEVKEAVPA